MREEIKNTKQLAEIIKNRRREFGMTQKELGDFSNLSVNGISKLESQRDQREIKLSSFLRMARILGLRLYVEEER